jgi:hypothetical protein
MKGRFAALVSYMYDPLFGQILKEMIIAMLPVAMSLVRLP